MYKIECKLTVFFDTPFWVGVYERIEEDNLEVCKITFGAEPKDYELYDFLLKNWNYLSFSPPVKAPCNHDVKINPKRMQRSIKQQLENSGIGTKSQQALKLQHEENKVAHKEKRRQQKDEEKQRQFKLRQQKHKEKHKGK